MAQYAAGHVLHLHAVAVVGDRNLLTAAAADIDAELACVRIQRVFHQFLECARRPLNHLAGCDHIRALRVKQVDPRHSNLHSAAKPAAQKMNQIRPFRQRPLKGLVLAFKPNSDVKWVYFRSLHVQFLRYVFLIPRQPKHFSARKESTSLRSA